ncbi:Uma2 family endonuclease [Asanoa sp. WMMD1127]|uniref:Uma2 family endonuclease n=1 Tax=Asanoa sp. WMMD1127 TaxID=3016107 RepID=UPI002416C1F0|nr:Uma2 family endonuclease [Asanoa sp. WMMD1127]MDG4823843.1 Uma2 family endonuclease [Asanoa sp. WMMD1127]
MTTLLRRLGAGPWTDEDYLALGETVPRVELIDGGLLISPRGEPGHQHVSRQLALALHAPARAAGLTIYPAVNVRLQVDRIVIPDLVLAATDEDGLLMNAADVALVCEITSPETAVTDRVVKTQLYADAAIPSYLLVERTLFSLTLTLFQLCGSRYAEVGTAHPGQLLSLTEPILVDLEVDHLS